MRRRSPAICVASTAGFLGAAALLRGEGGERVTAIEAFEEHEMKKWMAALVAAALAANYLLVVVAVIGAVSAIIVMVRLTGMLG